MTSNHHILSSLSILGLIFDHVSSICSCHHNLLVVMTIFGKSRDLKTKTPKTQAAYIFLQWDKNQRVECIQVQKLTQGFGEICAN